MSKRPLEEESLGPEPTHKRLKLPAVDRLSRLSDELILRMLSYLPVAELVVCERLSRKYKALARDGQLWKAHYYDRFVGPRPGRSLGRKDTELSNVRPPITSRTFRSLNQDRGTRSGAKLNWKRQYRLRSNWAKGTCAVNEIEVAEQAQIPPILVQMHDGVIYMADMAEGLRAWSAKGDQKMVAQTLSRPGRPERPPTCLAVDSQGKELPYSRIMVGFEDGSFSVYALDHSTASFVLQYSDEPSTPGIISAAAMSWPYVVTMTATQLLSVYRFGNCSKDDGNEALEPPELMHSLKSSTVWPPLATSLRTSTSDISISIAYALPTYLSGWTVGIQEVTVSAAGNLLSSRLASAIDQHYRPLAFSSPPIVSHLNYPTCDSPATSTTPEVLHIHSKPISLSYARPYLLVSHPDNTLTLYLVTSTSTSLSVSAGTRLWGHTSSVSGAHVGDRGKAVSVSKWGDELRVWELEGGFGSSTTRKRLATGEMSVRIRPKTRPSSKAISYPAELGLVNRAIAARRQSCAVEASEHTLTRGWVGFDEENVVVLKEHSQGRQALVVYDFT